MCLLVNQPAGHVFSDVELADFYKFNSDGIGVMWSENNTIHTVKLVPKTLQDVQAFYAEHAAGKQCSIHFRFTTHGHTDLTNCHPYQVFGEKEGYPLYLMHNGVLATGNAKDTTKSDTWHFIEDVIKPALKADPTQFMAPWFQTLIEDYIGKSNKFVMMDAYGNTMTFNEKSGIDVGEVWYSNTYAWSAPKPKYAGWKSNWNLKDDDADDDWTYPYKTTKKLISGNVATDPEDDYIDEEDYDANEFVFAFYDALDLMDMQAAYSALEPEDVKNYYLDYMDSAILTLDELENGFLTQAEIFHMFKLTPSAADASMHLQVGMQ